jgi:23S rRNA pseudouridine2605 synthase
MGSAQATPGAAAIEQAQALLARLVASGTVVALNLLGAVSEQPDFLAHRQALPYILCLRADADWKHAPQKSSGHKVSPLVLELWKALDREGVLSAAEARETLGRELTEAAVLRGLCELWQALRISPVFAEPNLAEPGQPARWELLRVRHREALATAGATSQVTALSLLVSMYLQSVYAASSEEIEIFLSPAASRSRVREAVRGLSATRQIHSLSMDAQTYYFLEDGLPQFAEPAVSPAGRADVRPALGAVGKVETPRRPIPEHRRERPTGRMRPAGPMRPAPRPARPPSPAPPSLVPPAHGVRPEPRPAAAPPPGRTEWKGPRRPAAQWRPGVKPPAMGGRAPGKEGGFRPARSFSAKTATDRTTRDTTAREPGRGAEAPRKGTRPETRGQERPDKRAGAWPGAQKRERPAPWARPGQGSAQNPRPPHAGDRRSSPFHPTQNPRPGPPRPSRGGGPVRGTAPNRFQGGRPGSRPPGGRPLSGRSPGSPPVPGAKRPWVAKRPPDAGRPAGQPGAPFRSRPSGPGRGASRPGRSGPAAPRSGPPRDRGRGTGPVAGAAGSNPGASAGRGGGYNRPRPGGYAKSGGKPSPGRDDQAARPPFVPGSRPAKSKPRSGATSGRPFGKPGGKPGQSRANFRGRKPARKKPGV